MKNPRLLKILLIYVLAGVVMVGISAPTSWAAVDMFMKIDGVKGESTDNKHREWIDVVSFSWGCSQPGGGSSSGGGGRSVQDLTVVKNLDKSSPKLALACANGQTIPAVTLELVVPPEDPASPEGITRYMKYVMRDVLISSVRPGGTVGGESLPLEEVSLNFLLVEMFYIRELPSGEPLDQEIAIVSNPDRVEDNPMK